AYHKRVERAPLRVVHLAIDCHGEKRPRHLIAHRLRQPPVQLGAVREPERAAHPKPRALQVAQRNQENRLRGVRLDSAGGLLHLRSPLPRLIEVPGHARPNIALAASRNEERYYRQGGNERATHAHNRVTVGWEVWRHVATTRTCSER